LAIAGLGFAAGFMAATDFSAGFVCVFAAEGLPGLAFVPLLIEALARRVRDL
jgi:hypothetical protein